jgi:hypothetical protein
LTRAAFCGLLGGMAKEVDDCVALLRRHGWSLGQYATATAWCAEASPGGVLVLATGRTQADAWQSAVAEALTRTTAHDARP